MEQYLALQRVQEKKIMDQYKAKQLLKFFLQKNKHEKCQVML